MWSHPMTKIFAREKYERREWGDIEEAYKDMAKEEDKKNKVFASGAQKDTANKLRMDLIPPEVDESYAEVLGLGANKYEDRNWERGVPYMSCVAALKRHLNRWLKGEDINAADGSLNHLQHAQFWVNALVTYVKRNRVDLDDRPSKKIDK